MFICRRRFSSLVTLLTFLLTIFLTPRSVVLATEGDPVDILLESASRNGDTGELKVYVKNIGLEDIGQDFSVSLIFLDTTDPDTPVSLGENNFPVNGGIMSGQEILAIPKMIPELPAGTTVIRAVADSMNEIGEDDEANNTMDMAVGGIPVGGGGGTSTPPTPAVHHPPVAANAEFSMLRNGFLGASVQASDPDDGDAVSFSITTSPTYGTLDLNTGTGQFYYYPNYNFLGIDSFQFVASDGELTSEEATATITVNQHVFMTRLEENLAADFNPAYDPENFEDFSTSLAAVYEETSVTFRPFVDDERVDEIEVTDFNEQPQVIAPGTEVTFNLSPGINRQFQFTILSQGMAIGRQSILVNREGPPLASLRVDGFELSPEFDPQTRYYTVNNIPFETESVSLFVENTDPAISSIRVWNWDESFNVSRASDDLGESFVLPVSSLNNNYFMIDTLDENEVSLGRYDISFYKNEKTLTGIAENLAADLSPAFNSDTRGYQLNASFEEAEVSLGVSSDDPAITGFRVAKDGKGSGEEELPEIIPLEQSFTVPLNFGWNTLTIQLYAEDQFAGNYFIDVYRQGPPLAALRVDGFELSPEFDSQNRYYTVKNIPFETQSVSLFVENTDPAISSIRVWNWDESFNVSRTSADLAEPFLLPVSSLNNNYFMIDTMGENDVFLGRYEISFYKNEKTLTAITENLAADLSPTFSSDSRWYQLNASFEEAEVTLGVSSDDPAITGFRVTKDGKGGEEELPEIIPLEQSFTVPLNFGWNTLTIQLYAEDQFAGNYFIDVYRQGLTLASLAEDVAGALSPAFQPEIRDYTLAMLPNEDAVTFSLTPGSFPETGRVRVVFLDVDQYIRPNESITLNVPNEENSAWQNFGVNFDLFLNEEPNSYVGSYSISINKFGATLDGLGEDEPNSDLVPVFHPGTVEYSLHTTSDVQVIRFTPTTQNELVQSIRTYVYYSDGGGDAGEEFGVIKPGATFEAKLRGPKTYVYMELLGADNVFLGFYQVTIEQIMIEKVEELLSSVSTLQSLTFNTPAALSPAFAPDVTTYALNVENTVSQIQLTPVAANAAASVRVKETNVTAEAPSPMFPLAVGANVFNVVVTAENGVATTTYTLTVNRAAEVAPPNGTSSPAGPSIQPPSAPPVAPQPAPSVVPPAKVLGEKISRLDGLTEKLHFGSKGKNVKELQLILKKRGYLSKKFHVNSYYGKTTEKAVARYHANNNGSVLGKKVKK